MVNSERRENHDCEGIIIVIMNLFFGAIDQEYKIIPKLNYSKIIQIYSHGDCRVLWAHNTARWLGKAVVKEWNDKKFNES